jgi:hypothetical protein
VNLASTEAIHLATRERTWVEVTTDQGSGAEVDELTDPPTLTISGSIDDKLIGGMSLYVGPPSAFPKPTHGGPGDHGPTRVTRAAAASRSRGTGCASRASSS